MLKQKNFRVNRELWRSMALLDRYNSDVLKELRPLGGSPSKVVDSPSVRKKPVQGMLHLVPKNRLWLCNRKLLGVLSGPPNDFIYGAKSPCRRSQSSHLVH